MATSRRCSDKLSARISERLQEIETLKAAGQEVWPTIPFRDIAEGTVSDELCARAIKRRGCAVIVAHFPREHRRWRGIPRCWEYLDRNHFDDVYKAGPGDSFFGSLEASRPEIYPILLVALANAGAAELMEMAAVQSFLNRLWRFEQNGKRWSDPDVSVIYPGPQNIRRRPPGTTSKGLGAHTDSGALERWLLPAYQQVFANVFLMAISTPTTRGTPRTVPKWKSIPSTTPPNARCSVPSRAGPRCRT
ncbi:DUF1479 domain-containing protein [Klebsiella pneumoniae]|nr:DUF1479 domain-containing protein [Klebsiella pneumoniae]